MTDDSRVLSSGPADLETLGRTGWLLLVYAVGIRSQGGFWYRAAVAGAMMDDVTRAARTRAPAASSTAGKPPRWATRRRAMHPTIVINGSNIVAARLTSRRRQVPLRQRGELSARLCHAAGFRPVSRLSGWLLRYLAAAKPVRSDLMGLISRGYYNAKLADILPPAVRMELNYLLRLLLR